ncbi:helix-turn-helix domain-containing protein [Kordiimonas pumila]|uniref:Helix-turn-helix domain-containing protein n=1 Tax=Kordiimonas pumila TaxID=2161677 RepID=A0ABV7D6E9_9PROT|nr:helix-turn-helix domain-containing protein [Kordiimonas pumila]
MVSTAVIDISEVSKLSGLPASTLRFYEEKRLIHSIGRRGLRRLFPATIMERLALITLGRKAGFSLDDIARMFAPDGTPKINREQLVAKAHELDRTIKQLETMRDGLQHAALCTAPSHMECPKFQRLLKAASKKSTYAPQKNLEKF